MTTGKPTNPHFGPSFDDWLKEQGIEPAELEALDALPEDQINTRDAPEQRDWSTAQRGLFFRPVKKQRH